MASGEVMKKALRSVLVPKLRDSRFAGSFPHFRRREGEELHLLSVQFDKWGGSFFLEFARCQPGSRMLGNQEIPEDRLNVSYLSREPRARLEERPRAIFRNSWFAFGSFADDEKKCAELAKRVGDLLPEANAWLRSGTKGPHVRT